MQKPLQLILLTFLLCSILLQGCGRKLPEPIPPFQVQDRARMLTPGQVMQLSQYASEMNRLVDAKVGLVTLPRVDSTELSGFADQTFEKGPFFRTLETSPEHKDDTASENREKWDTNGILILAIQQPSVVIIRCGANYRGQFDDVTLFEILERRVNPKLLQKKPTEAISEAAHALSERIAADPRAINDLNWFQRRVVGTLHVIRKFRFPTWRIYYACILDPMLNSLVLTMQWSHLSLWGIVLWLFLFQCGLSVANKAWDWFWFGISLRLFPIDPSGSEERDARRALCGKLSGFVTTVVQIGLGVPIWACISLVTLPFWENVLTLRQHLAPALQASLDLNVNAHRFFSAQEGFLWWARPSQPAGIFFGLFFGILNFTDTGLQLWNISYVALLNPQERQRSGISNEAAAASEESLNNHDHWKDRIAYAVFMPFAIACLPALLGFYYLFDVLLRTMPLFFQVRQTKIFLKSKGYPMSSLNGSAVAQIKVITTIYYVLAAFAGISVVRLFMSASLHSGTMSTAPASAPNRNNPALNAFVDSASQRRISEAQLKGRSAWEITLLRNEPYARHGCTFKNDAIRQYFGSRAWYRATGMGFDSGWDRMTKVEQHNAQFLLNYQRKHGQFTK